MDLLGQSHLCHGASLCWEPPVQGECFHLNIHQEFLDLSLPLKMPAVDFQQIPEVLGC